MTRRPSKAQRRAALAELLAGLPEPAELPPECDQAESIITSEIVTPQCVTISEDGKLLTGSQWITPSDYQEAEVEAGELASLKGCTPPTLPGLDGEDTGEGGVYP